MQQARQLTLPLRLQDDANFSNFFSGTNQALIPYLKAFIQGKQDNYLYLWGHSGVGCSHLLQACCQFAQAHGLTAAYLPLRCITKFTPALLDELELLSLVCLDDLPAIAGRPAWEEAVFHLYNRMQSNNNRLLVTAPNVPRELNIQLPDLTSRLASGVIIQVQALSDEEKIAALQLRANLRGLKLPTEAAQFLLHRYPRDFAILFNALEKLDQASLREQHKLTIPFIKKVLMI